MVPRDAGEVLMEYKAARTYFRRADFEQWGSQRRLSRVPVFEKWPEARQQAHSEACRKRIEGLLKGDSVGAARLAAADERINRVLADAVERHAAKDPGVRGHTEEGQCHLSSRVGIPKEDCTGHTAGIDTTPLGLVWRIIRIRHATQHHHQDRTGRRHE